MFKKKLIEYVLYLKYIIENRTKDFFRGGESSYLEVFSVMELKF